MKLFDSLRALFTSRKPRVSRIRLSNEQTHIASRLVDTTNSVRFDQAYEARFSLWDYLRHAAPSPFTCSTAHLDTTSATDYVVVYTELVDCAEHAS